MKRRGRRVERSHSLKKLFKVIGWARLSHAHAWLRMAAPRREKSTTCDADHASCSGLPHPSINDFRSALRYVDPSLPARLHGRWRPDEFWFGSGVLPVPDYHLTCSELVGCPLSATCGSAWLQSLNCGSMYRQKFRKFLVSHRPLARACKIN